MKSAEQIKQMSLVSRFNYGLASWSLDRSVKYDLTLLSDSETQRLRQLLRAADCCFSTLESKTRVNGLRKVINTGDDETARYDVENMPSFALAIAVTFSD